MAPAGTQQTDVPLGGVRSLSARTCTLVVMSTGEEMEMPVKISSRVGPIRDWLSDKLGVQREKIAIVRRTGIYPKVQLDVEEVGARVFVRGIESFEPKPMEYPHPHCIVGAGMSGLRQALCFLEHKEKNFVIFDRHDRVGGNSWLDHANMWSKVQTELGTYQLSYSPACKYPSKSLSPWPSRDEILEHFEQVVDEWGIKAHLKLQMDSKRFDIIKARNVDKEQYYSMMSIDRSKGEPDEHVCNIASVVHFPGSMTNARQEDYRGEEMFGGPITYGMCNETEYDMLSGRDVAIIGMGAFAIENIRTCCEHNVNKIYLICRRQNLCMPRMISWWINSSLYPISGADVLRSMEEVYALLNDDPWEYTSVSSSPSRTTATITQRARFAISDIYFLSRYFGKTEVVPGVVKKISRGSLHLDTAAKVEAFAILKCLGFFGDWGVDKFLQLKELTGFWVNDDYRRCVAAEFPTINAGRFGGTSRAIAQIQYCNIFWHFLSFPRNFEKMMDTGMMPRHKQNFEKDEQGYILDAKSGGSTLMLITSSCPEVGDLMAKYGDKFKRERNWGTHSVAEVQELAEQEWIRYSEMFRETGATQEIPPYPYSVDLIKSLIRTQDAEESAHSKTKAFDNYDDE